MLNPESNRIEMGPFLEGGPQLLQPNGEPVPKTWIRFQVGEVVQLKSWSFKVAYINESSIMLEPYGPLKSVEDLRKELDGLSSRKAAPGR